MFLSNRLNKSYGLLIMKSISTKSIITAMSLTALSFGASAVMADAEQQALTKEAQGLVKQFGGQLKPELKKAMKAGGPVAAVEVCQQKAPAIAVAIAKESGWNITRVSLKARGANATPDSWEKQALENFDSLRLDGHDVKAMQYSAMVKTAQGSEFRYIKPIQTGGVCLQCHGEQVAEPVKQAIARYYPNDKATGYKQGEIRGAFSFSKVIK